MNDTKTMIELQKYKDYSPCPWDVKGLNAGSFGIGEWYVLLIKTRDSDSLEESNYEVCRRRLEEEFGEEFELDRNNPADPVEPCYKPLGEWDGMLPPLPEILEEKTRWAMPGFNHWACGHFDLLIVENTLDGAAFAGEIMNALDNYPVLDEDDWSQRENAACWAYFESWQHGEMKRDISREWEDVYPKICHLIQKFDADDVWAIVHESNWEVHEDNYHFDDDAFNLNNATAYAWEHRTELRKR